MSMRREPLPLNPKSLLSPTLSSFLGRRGRRSLGLHAVQGFNARNWLRGILTPALSPFGWGEGDKTRASSVDHHFEAHRAFDGALDFFQKAR